MASRPNRGASPPITIAHVTTTHQRFDTRVFVKECKSLAQKPTYSLHMVVADGLGADRIDGVKIYDIGRARGPRPVRLLLDSWRMWKAVRKIHPTLVHFHDPELIVFGLVIKLTGCKVIYDVHEDYSAQVEYKHWVPRPLAPVLRGIIKTLNRLAGMVFDGFAVVTPRIADQFPQDRSWIVRNFPRTEELGVTNRTPNDPPSFLYVGGLFEARGVREMVDALDIIGARRDVALELGGKFVPVTLQQELENRSGWKHVRYLGFLSREDVRAALARASAGLVVLHPVRNLMTAYPVKLFEYMAAGLPVIASDFPVWRNLLDGVDCAVFVDPLKPEEISAAMEWILDHPEEAAQMGERGRQAVAERYNWDAEATTLSSMYDHLLSGHHGAP